MVERGVKKADALTAVAHGQSSTGSSATLDQAKGTDKSGATVERDDLGRMLVKLDKPIVGAWFQPRASDRRSRVKPPWSADQILSALAAAENGDLGPQSDLFEMMEDRDPALLGFYQTRKLAPAKKTWSIEPINDTPEAKAVAEFVRDEIRAIQGFPNAYRDVFDAVGKSISALWLDWQPGGRRHGGKAPQSDWRIQGMHHINPKRYRFHWAAERFLILPDADFDKAQSLGLSSDLSPTYFSELEGAGIGIEPPPWKVLVHRTRIKSGHPAKAGVLRVCAMFFYFRNAAFKDVSVYCEIYGMPLRVGKYPPGSTDQDKAELQAGLESLGSDAAAIVSNLMDISFEESSSRTGGGAPYLEFLKECERQLALAVLGQDQTNTHNPSGGRTQVAEGGSVVRQDLLEADCIDAQTTLTQQLCFPIVGFSHYGWEAAETLCPRFKIHYEPSEDYVTRSQVDEVLYTKLGLPFTYGRLAKDYGRELPPNFKTPDDVVQFPASPNAGLAGLFGQPTGTSFPPKKPKPGQPPIPPKRPGVPGRKPVKALGSGGDTEAQVELDDMITEALPYAEDFVASLTATARAIVMESKSLQEIPGRLAAAFSDLDQSELETLIRRSMFVAKLHGMASARRVLSE